MDLSCCSSVIRASVPKLDLDSTFEQKNEIAKAVEEELEKAMSAYGYEIVQTLIVDIEPDEHVKRAMNEINAGMYLCLCINRISRDVLVFFVLFLKIIHP
uniref:Band 7 domain-containing protein n=1 Tax=Nelumbo nucifera TaxID=4432 RepID=A0A822YFG3_NELNU|nr:TPA_asm: hypothetical protein HUJ06_010013 [Nelumbo nucifera]